MGEISAILLQNGESKLQRVSEKVPNLSSWTAGNWDVRQITENYVVQFPIRFSLLHKWDTVAHDDLVVLRLEGRSLISDLIITLSKIRVLSSYLIVIQRIATSLPQMHLTSLHDHLINLNHCY